MNVAPPVIETIGLTVRREGRALVDGVSLTVERGSVHAIIGPNGAGKSTFLSAVLGQTRFSGKVTCRFENDGIIGFVPQTLPVDRTLPITAIELLALSRQKRPICFGIADSVKRRAEKLLDRVGLSGFATRRLGALSGGELQRLLFANVLDPEPELVLLDEPASGLDHPSVLRLEALVKELARVSSAAVLLVSHDIGQVRRLADRVTYLDGKVRAQGSVDEVLGDRPVFPFVDGAAVEGAA